MKQFCEKMKKTLCVFLVCIVAFSVFSTGVSAEETTMPEYINYTISDGKVKITKCNCRFTKYETVVIPETVDGCPVTSIDTSAFASCIHHNTIQLPSTIEKIGLKGLSGSFDKILMDENNNFFSSDENGVLYNEEKTELLQYPKGKTETSYIVPDDVETIGQFAFYQSPLTEIIFSDSVKTIAESAFNDNDNLAVVNIPDNVETLKSYAFGNCISLEEIYLGAGVSSIGNRALGGDLKKVNISDDNQYFCNDENGVVYTKDMKELIYYPGGITNEKFVVPEGVVSFGDEQISSKYLKEIVLSSTVENVEQAFFYCSVLECISVAENSAFFSNDEYGVLYNKDKTELVRCPRATTQTEYIVPDSVEKLGKYAFYNCIGLESIRLSPKITDISQFALQNCKGLKSLYLPSGVKSFAEQSFLGTTSVTDIYYFGTAEQWDSLLGKDYLQNDILNTATIHLGYGLTSGTCGENVNWSYNEENGNLTISGNGEITEQMSFDDYGWYSFKDKITYVEIGSEITNVPAFAFDGCTELKEVYLSESVEKVGEKAFAGCENLYVISSTAVKPIVIAEDSIELSDKAIVVCKAENTTLAELVSDNTVLVSFDEEKKILHFEGEITVYPDVEYNFLSKFMLERTNSEYILFDKVVFEDVRPDFIDPSQFENMEEGETNLTLTNLYVSLKVIQGDTERTITFEEMLELLEEGNFDVFKYVIESEEESGEKPFLVKIGECIVEFTERALRAISSVINFIAKLFKKKK